MGYYFDPINMEMVWDGVNEVAAPEEAVSPLTSILSNIAPTISVPGTGYFNNESGQVAGADQVANPLYQRLSALPQMNNLQYQGGVVNTPSGTQINGAGNLIGPNGERYYGFSAGNAPMQFNFSADGQLRSGSTQGDGTYFDAQPVGTWQSPSGETFIITQPNLNNYQTYAPMADSGMTDSWTQFAQEFVLPVLLTAAGAGAFGGAGGAEAAAAGSAGAAESAGAAALADGAIAGGNFATSAFPATEAAAAGQIFGPTMPPLEAVLNSITNAVSNPATLIESALKKAAVNAAVQTTLGGNVDPESLLASTTLGMGLGVAGGALGQGLSAAGVPDAIANFGGNALVQTAAGANPENIALNAVGTALGNEAQSFGIPSVVASPLASAIVSGIAGGDPLMAAANSGIKSAINGGFNSLLSSPIFSDLVKSVPQDQVAGTSDTNMDGFITSQELPAWATPQEEVTQQTDPIENGANMDSIDMTGFMDNAVIPDWLTQDYQPNQDYQSPFQNLINTPMADNYLKTGSAFDTSGLIDGLSSIIGNQSSNSNSGGVLSGIGNVLSGALNSITGGGNGSSSGGQNYFLPLLGAILGGMSGQRQAGTTTVVNDVPEWLKPNITNLLTRAQDQFNASTSDTNRNSLLAPATQTMNDTITGKYLDPSTNPWLKSTYDQAARSVSDAYNTTTQPRTDALFNKAGAFGPQNSAYAEQVARNQFGLGQNLSDLATSIYGGNYQQERKNQLAATTAAPDFTTASSNSTFAPYQNYANTLKGWGSQQSTPYYNNPYSNVLGGALAGYGATRLFGKDESWT
jgi:hypothetical protein